MKQVIKQRLEWGIALGADAIVLIAGIGLILVARMTDLPDEPWIHVGFFIAAVGVVGELALGIARAGYVSNHPSNLRPRG